MIRFKYMVGCMFFSINAILCAGQDGSVKVKVFDGTPTDTPSNTPNPYNARNFFYINPFVLPRGILAFGYERVLHEKHSVTFDLGLTYRDYVYESVSDFDFSLTGSNTEKIRLGKYWQAAYKFYFRGVDDFDGGFYISPSVIFRNYNISDQIEYYNGAKYVPAVVDKSYRMNEYALKFGYCWESWFLDDLISDVYFGVGSRAIATNGYENSNNTLKLTNSTVNKPAVYFGIKFGLVF